MVGHLSLVFAIVQTVGALNVLVYSPSFGGSHTNFMARLADTLTEAGHNVTFLVPVIDEARKDQLGVKLTTDVYLVEQDDEMKQASKPFDDEMGQYWSADIDSSNAEAVFQMFQDAIARSCENFLRNKHVFSEMRARNFDVAILEPVSVCGLAFLYALGVSRTILASSCALYDGSVVGGGETLDVSYVPGMMSKSDDRMNIFERLENYRLTQTVHRMQFGVWDIEVEIYRRYLGDKVPHWRELMPAASVFFTNSIPYVDFPRPIGQKTVPIGGISMDVDHIRRQSLSPEWHSVLDERPYSMLISFGSMVRSVDMPKDWRAGLLAAIKSEPNVTFIWKYESDDVAFADGISNVHFSKWVPQTALLNDARLTAFLTHAGLGSTMELAHLGKPALMVPIFGDQERNARMLARHGGVTVLRKTELANTDLIRNAIRSVLHEEKFRTSATRLAQILERQPLKPKEQVIKYTEFVGEFGPFPNMDPYGRQLGFIQRNLLDVYALLALPYLLIIFALIISIRVYLSKFSIKLVKND